MPVQKRYFHCSQDIIADPEVWEMIKEFGDRFILTWLQILIYLERTNNHWRLSGDWLAVLSRSVRQSSANLRRQVGQLVAKGWLEVGETSADGSPLVLKGRNWLKYNNRRELKNISDAPLPSLPNPSLPNHSLPKDKKEKKMPLRATFVADTTFFDSLRTNPAYQHINLTIEDGKMNAWLALPQNRTRVKTRRFVLNWLNKIERPMTVNGTMPQVCQERVQRGAFLKPCGAPSTGQLGGRPLCQQHKEYHESKSHPATA